jgi:alkylated DNA nucleotide flippase Atl1
MVISTPADIDGVVRKIPRGRLATMTTFARSPEPPPQDRHRLPVTTGIFLGIVAKTAAEMEEMGARRVAPWWRVLKSDGSLNPRMPGGMEEQRRRLEAEGFKVARKGKSAS